MKVIKLKHAKMIRLMQFLLVCCGLLWCNTSLGATKILLLSSAYTDHIELDSLERILNEGGNRVFRVTLDKLDKAILRKADAVYYHRPDSAALGSDEQQARLLLLPYVKQGGRLLLTMEAVRLLNQWSVEPTPVEPVMQNAADAGLGFHAYREHPLFEGLNGGAYVWKSKNNNQVRTLGFSAGYMPSAPGTRVLGINWTFHYIRYDENRKLIWETPYGKGKILAVGAYLYFSKQNPNRQHLSKFMLNLTDYLTESRSFKTADRYWPLDTVKVEKVDFPAAGLGLNIPEKSAHWTCQAPKESREGSRNNFWNVSGQRLVAMGKEQGVLEELWIHPIMALRDWTVGIVCNGRTLWLDSLPVHITMHPGCIERSYTVPGGGLLTEQIVASHNEPLLAMKYRWKGADISRVLVAYSTNLRLMWPYSQNATGRIQYAVSEDGRITVASDKQKELNIVTAFTQYPLSVEEGQFNLRNRMMRPVRSEELPNRQVAFFYQFAGKEKQLDVCLSGGEEGLEHSFAVLKKYKGQMDDVHRSAENYYADFDSKYLSIESSDAKFNKAYRWGLTAIEQLFAYTPSIGKSLMAGYWSTSRGWGGGHKVSGRPGYAWYFGRDTDFCALAMNSYGATGQVKEILSTFSKYQDLNGKIYHELTTSGSALYDAADATPLYLVLAGDYLRKTGDIAFISSLWPSLKRAMDYCYSTDTDSDGLIENTHVGHGWQETGRLLGAHTEVYLAAVWAEALRQAEYIAAALGFRQSQVRYARDFVQVKGLINGKFWNDSMQFFNHGLMQDGTFQEQKCVLGGTPVSFGLADSVKAVKTALNFSSRYYSTDWGVRMVGYDSPYYAIGGYSYGNVWPFHTGYAALAEYKAGLLSQGFRHAYGSLRLYSLWDYGHIAEVIQGDRLAFTGICPHQGWSSGTNLLPLYGGMLGLEADALQKKLVVSPAFPADWSYAKVKNISVANGRVHLNYNRTDEGYTYVISKEGKEHIQIDFSARLPLATQVKKVEINGHPVAYTLTNELQCVRINVGKLPNPKDTLTLTVYTEGGVAVLQNLSPLATDMPDDGLKIEMEQYDTVNHTYTLQLAGRSGKLYDVELFVRPDVVSVENATLKLRDGDRSIYTVQMDTVSDKSFVGHTLRLKF